jgi:hypothetical protein
MPTFLGVLQEHVPPSFSELEPFLQTMLVKEHILDNMLVKEHILDNLLVKELLL